MTNQGSHRPRVTYVIGTYPLLTTTFIDREVRMLRAEGVDVDVVSLRRPHQDLSPEQAELEAQTTYIRPLRTPVLAGRHLRYLITRPGRYLSTLLRLVSASGQSWRQRIRTFGHFGLAVHVAGELDGPNSPDRIHAHFIDRAAIMAHVASRLLDVPYSITAHASDIYVDPVLLGLKIGDADFVTTCTGYNARHLGETVNEADGTVELLYHGLELDNYQPTGQGPTGTPTLLAVGQLKQKKGFVHLIEACARLRSHGINVRCEIIGEGPQRAELAKLIGDLDLADVVTLRGAQPHDEVIDAYRRAWAFVLPCVIADDGDRDGIPNVILEAMAMELPVVSTDHSGIPEAVEDGESGLLVAAGDTDELHAALDTILADGDEARRMGRRGREVVKARFDAATNATTLAQAFEAEVATR